MTDLKADELIKKLEWLTTVVLFIVLVLFVEGAFIFSAIRSLK